MARTLKDTGSENTISSNIDGAVYSLITPDCVIGGMGDEFTLNYSASSLDVNFAKGSQALICGNAFWLDDIETVTLPSSSTIYLCARIDTSMPNGQTGSFECLTQSGMKSDNINEGGVRDLLLYIIVTNSSGVSSVTDKRNIVNASQLATKTYVDNLIGDLLNSEV